MSLIDHFPFLEEVAEESGAPLNAVSRSIHGVATHARADIGSSRPDRFFERALQGLPTVGSVSDTDARERLTSAADRNLVYQLLQQWGITK